MASKDIDNIETTRIKIMKNLGSLAETLAVLSEDLRSKGFNVSDGNSCKTTILIGSKLITPDQLVMDFVATTKPLWDDLFSVNPANITSEQMEKIKKHLPERLAPIINPLLDCRTDAGKLAMDVRISNLLFTYLRAFVKLGLKIIFFKQQPQSVTFYDGVYHYTYTDTKLSDSLDLNLNLELHNRKVVGLPTNF